MTVTVSSRTEEDRAELKRTEPSCETLDHATAPEIEQHGSSTWQASYFNNHLSLYFKALLVCQRACFVLVSQWLPMPLRAYADESTRQTHQAGITILTTWTRHFLDFSEVVGYPNLMLVITRVDPLTLVCSVEAIDVPQRKQPVSKAGRRNQTVDIRSGTQCAV